MAKPYATEMANLAGTFTWAIDADLKPLRQAVSTAAHFPLRAIGSGGSLTAAHVLACLHQRYAGQIAAVSTPLEAVYEPVDSSVSNWLLSAGGGNVDILAAAKVLIEREPRHLAVLCGKESSPLANLSRMHAFVDLLLYPPPVGKDGFLATNSLLGFGTLLTRAYQAVFCSEAAWAEVVRTMRALLAPDSLAIENWRALTAALWSRTTTVVLYGPASRMGAIDLESKFSEAALGNLQLADYRNFAHGRHHWLAKHGATSAILAFVTEADRNLARKTLAIIPAEIPKVCIDLPGSSSSAALASLVAALRISGWAGEARGIDPGMPGVPDFGRRLYNLNLPRTSIRSKAMGISERDLAAVTRKSGLAAERLEDLGELEFWKTALGEFRQRIYATTFVGVVLDYDGTVVDTRHRFDPMSAEMKLQMIRILEANGWLAFATGRGASIRKDLQARIPHEFWPRVLVGYYNGAEVATLAENNAPDGTVGSCSDLASLASALREQPELALVAEQSDRRFQITLNAERAVAVDRLWDLANHVLLVVGSPNVSLTRSGHSIDVLAPGVSKLNVLTVLRSKIGAAPLLTIGDRGRWPGNDHQLLREVYSLGVDEISPDPATCWNLARPGQRGASVTLEYLAALEPISEGLRFKPGSLQ